MAISQDVLGTEGFSCGDQYYIEGHGDKVYTVTDSGTFPKKDDFEIYAGELYHDEFYAKYPDTGTLHRIARIRK